MYIFCHIVFIIAAIIFCILRIINIFPNVTEIMFFNVLGTIWAALEVQIEGKYGWATELPTNKFFGTKFTWYHVMMNCMVIMTVFMSVKWSWRVPYWISGLFLIEDYMWFMINPHFGIKNYNSENVWWHSWWGNQPSGNWISTAIMSISSVCSYYFENDTTLLWFNLVNLSYLLLATILNYFLVSPKKLDKSPYSNKIKNNSEIKLD